MKQFLLSLLFVFALCHPVVAAPLSDTSHIKGDANVDGYVNISDVSFIINIILGQANVEYSFDAVDVNNDGFINMNDTTMVISIILGENDDSGNTPPGVDDDDANASVLVSFSSKNPPSEAD